MGEAETNPLRQSSGCLSPTSQLVEDFGGVSFEEEWIILLSMSVGDEICDSEMFRLR